MTAGFGEAMSASVALRASSRACRAIRVQRLIVAGLLALPLVSGCSLSRLSREQRALYEQLSSSGSDPYVEVCPIHRIPTEVRSVPAYGGLAVLPPERYIRARLRLFPYSFLDTVTGWCEQASTVYVERWVCPACRAAEIKWRQSHGYELPEDLLADPSGEVANPGPGGPGPTVHRRLRLVRVECRRLLDFGIPELEGLPAHVAVQGEAPSVSDDRTTRGVFLTFPTAEVIAETRR